MAERVGDPRQLMTNASPVLCGNCGRRIRTKSGRCQYRACSSGDVKLSWMQIALAHAERDNCRERVRERRRERQIERLAAAQQRDQWSRHWGSRYTLEGLPYSRISAGGPKYLVEWLDPTGDEAVRRLSLRAGADEW